MKVDDYKFRWEYTDKQTICYIELVQPTVLKETVCLCYRASTRNSKDKFCKEIGRRISLKRALLSAFPTNDTIDGYNYRSKVWEKYRTLTKTPRW